ncbi:MAG: DUF1801 domain-containing protein [Candidatus Nitronauta litoralis]|uniref:DUF1801 domain-containing protein n=1 Tax=Candidatus Nitronauta litoralis TaxID=2705533 RepID=A0A7T0FYZ3_9BACT|nr:MAG: DUF1801 domain-containing protein [Candidatus Nitronauta litoralis]
MKAIKNSIVYQKFKSYPEPFQSKLLFLRQLVFDTVQEAEGIENLEETLKWGEPSYISNSGSTLRMDYKKSKPNQYALYFHCQTKLVDTFKELYCDKFNFEGNRAIIFNEDDEIPIKEIKHCIAMTLTYHRIKHLPLLGAGKKSPSK